MAKYEHKFSIWLGTLIELMSIFLGFLILSIINVSFHSAINLLLLLAAWFCFWFFPHCLSHFLVGRSLGIDFRFYFVGKSGLARLDLPIISLLTKNIPILGIKIDQEPFLRVTPKKRALMFASGAIASMTFPIICIVYALMYLPSWITTLVSTLTIGNICFTLVYSSKVGDLCARRTLKHG